MNEDLDKFVEERAKAIQEAEDKAKAEAEEKAQAEYMKAKAEAETKEQSLIIQDSTKALQTKLNLKVAQHIDSSQAVAEKIEQAADKLIEKGLQEQQNKIDTELNKSRKDKNKSEFELEENQYRAFGQETAPEEPWKKKLIKYGYNFWFVIISLICFVSLAPFYIFMKVIQSQKGILRFVTIAVGVLLILACLGGLTYWVLKASGAIQ